MVTADKLTTVAENVPKVYHAGQLNVVQSAQSLKGSESNTAMLIDDVSPVTHEMGVKVREKNLIPYPYPIKAATTNGITFTDNGDGTITANGTATANATYAPYSVSKYFTLHIGKTYTISDLNLPTDSNLNTYYLQFKYVDTDSHITHLLGNNKYFTFTAEQEKIRFNIVIKAGVTVENLVFKPQIELGNTATSYTPYVPDLTAVKVSRCGKNLFNQYAESKFIYPYRGIVVSDFCNNVNSAMYTLSVSLKQGATFQEGINFGLIRMDNSNDSSARWFQTKTDTNFRFTYTSMNSLDHIPDFYVALIGIYPSTEDNWNRIINNYNIQIEYGKPPTDYEPYQECADYTPNSDGTVNGVESLYPSTTLLTNDPYGKVYIDCDYYKDIDKTFNELTTSVALSGGE